MCYTLCICGKEITVAHRELIELNKTKSQCAIVSCSQRCQNRTIAEIPDTTLKDTTLN